MILLSHSNPPPAVCEMIPLEDRLFERGPGRLFSAEEMCEAAEAGELDWELVDAALGLPVEEVAQ